MRSRFRLELDVVLDTDLAQSVIEACRDASNAPSKY